MIVRNEEFKEHIRQAHMKSTTMWLHITAFVLILGAVFNAALTKIRAATSVNKNK